MSCAETKAYIIDNFPDVLDQKDANTKAAKTFIMAKVNEKLVCLHFFLSDFVFSTLATIVRTWFQAEHFGPEVAPLMSTEVTAAVAREVGSYQSKIRSNLRNRLLYCGLELPTRMAQDVQDLETAAPFVRDTLRQERRHAGLPLTFSASRYAYSLFLWITHAKHLQFNPGSSQV
jgi:hypothetical protein